MEPPPNLTETPDNNTMMIFSIYLVPVQWDWRLLTQLILSIVGIIGNSAVIHVYLHTRKLTTSATNRFIAALAVADIVTSISIIPIPTLSYVPDNFGGHFYCKIVTSSVVMWTSIVASVFLLTTLAVERFVAIVKPIRYKSFFTVKTTRIIIAVIWLFSFTFNTFVIYVNHLDSKSGTCYVDFGDTRFQIFIGVAAFIVEYLVPVTLMLFANVRSIQLLNIRARVFTSKSQTKNLDLLLARQRIIYMLLVVIICFICCWSPDQFAFLAFNLGLVPFEYLYGNLYRAFVVLAFANSCINPVLYTLTNKNFRHAIKQHLFRFSVRAGEPENGLFDTPLEGADIQNSGSKISTDGSNLSVINSASLSPSVNKKNSSNAIASNV